MKTRPWSQTPARWLTTIGILFVAAACSGAAGDRSSTAVPTPTSTPTRTPASTQTPASSPTLGAVIALSEGRHTAQVMGNGSYPVFTVVVPEGWYDGGGHFVIKYPVTDTPGPVLGLSVWNVGQVYRDPCHWQGSQFDPGPGVKALVTALVAQPIRNATKPTDVTLAGYHGQYFEWSVPADLKSSTWTDFDTCDVEPSNGHHDFRSWLGNGMGTRYLQVPGQVDRLWVLDVKGQRLVVDATYSPDTTQADRDELAHIVESLRFVAP